MAQRLYNEKQIREAVDITIGDDGFRSKEVIEILRLDNVDAKEIENTHTETILKLIDKQMELEQNIINVDAKYNLKLKKLGECLCKAQI